MELDLNGIHIEFSEMLGLVDAVKIKKILKKLALKLSSVKMNLNNLKMMLKSIRGIDKLSDLKLDIWIQDHNNLNMLKSFSHLASLSQLSINLNRNKIKYQGAKKLLRPLARHANLT